MKKLYESGTYKGVSHEDVRHIYLSCGEPPEQHKNSQKHRSSSSQQCVSMQLESLDEIKKRDHSNEQKRILESINERKERSYKAVYGEQYTQNQPKNPKLSESQNAKSFAYLEKVKRQAGLEDDNREAFNFHRVLK